MSVSEMRALRALYTHKLLKPTTHKPHLASFQSLQNPNFSRHFHSTTHLRRSEEPPSPIADYLKSQTNPSSGESTRRVWAVYRPVSETLAAQRVSNEISDGQEPTSEIETKISDGLQPRGEIETQMGFSSLKEEEKAGWSDKKVNSGSGYSRDIVKKKKGKVRTSWVCSNCGDAFGQWWGSCRSCHERGTLQQFSERSDDKGGKVSGVQVSEKALRSWMPQEAAQVKPIRLTDVNRGVSVTDRRIPLFGAFGNEVERVLGGGVVRGSLVLIGGDPGVGKSTLALQMASLIAEGHELGKAVVYVSGEESVEQIGSRADRMNIEAEDLFLYSSTDIEDILEKIQSLNPQALIIDSIQTVYLEGVAGSAGGVLQLKECTSTLLRFAKKTNVPVLLIGHVTKSGEIAGPRILEHIVDVVLYMEGEKTSSHRLLRSVKNRFGSTDELGIFEMSQSGLQAVANPSGMFLSEQYSDSEILAGLAVAVVMDGSRTFLIEIQALCVSESTVSRQVNGIPTSRADMIISVLTKQAGLKLQDNAVFLNVVSGLPLKETAGDLAIAAAICSSFLEFPLPNSIAFIGEIGLGGELRSVPRMDKRIITVAKLGYKRCFVPESAVTFQRTAGCEDMNIIGCKDLKEMISTVFK